MVYQTFDQLIERVKGAQEKKRMVVACANDDHSIGAALQAAQEGVARPILVGDRAVIETILHNFGAQLPQEDIYHASELQEACALAVQLIRMGKGDFLMKGKVDTGIFLKEVVNKEHGLGKGGVMSHVTLFQVPGYHKLLVPVDGGMVTYPTLEQKKAIIENTVAVLRRIGYDCPKVGVLACMEKVNPKMPETVEARALQEMNQRGELSGCIVEGPISYDCAVDGKIAAFKGYESQIAGDVDILLAPNIHAGNIMGKMLSCTCQAMLAGFVEGAICPVVMTSRGSSTEEKYLSIVLAAAASSSSRELVSKEKAREGTCQL